MLLPTYLEVIGLPNIALVRHGKFCHDFINRKIFTLWQAIEYVQKLPYGRTSDRANSEQILIENKGACSGKHALLAALAAELAIPLHLTLSILLLNSNNTPKLAPILSRYRLEAIPEAHCYLQYEQHSLDITFPNATHFSFDTAVAQTISITPQQIGTFKTEAHRAFIRNWLEDKPTINFDTVWTAREMWIKELSLHSC